MRKKRRNLVKATRKYTRKASKSYKIADVRPSGQYVQYCQHRIVPFSNLVLMRLSGFVLSNLFTPIVCIGFGTNLGFGLLKVETATIKLNSTKCVEPLLVRITHSRRPSEDILAIMSCLYHFSGRCGYPRTATAFPISADTLHRTEKA